MTTSTQLPKCWADVQLALDAGIDRVILFGPPGTGKTFAGMNFGEVNRGAFRVICTDDITWCSTKKARSRGSTAKLSKLGRVTASSVAAWSSMRSTKPDQTSTRRC